MRKYGSIEVQNGNRSQRGYKTAAYSKLYDVSQAMHLEKANISVDPWDEFMKALHLVEDRLAGHNKGNRESTEGLIRAWSAQGMED